MMERVLALAEPLCAVAAQSAQTEIAYSHDVTARNKHFQRAVHMIREEITYQRL